jgi:hypothetical protein
MSAREDFIMLYLAVDFKMRVWEYKLSVLVLACVAIPLQALTGPEGSRRLRLPDF